MDVHGDAGAGSVGISHGQGFSASKIMTNLLKRDHWREQSERADLNAASEKGCLLESGDQLTCTLCLFLLKNLPLGPVAPGQVTGRGRIA